MIPTPPQGGNSSPMYQTMESLVYQQPMPPPDRFPLPDMDLMGIEDDTSPYAYGGQSVEQKKELLLVGRNSLDLLTSIINSGMEPIPINDELTVSMLEKCKESLPVIQRIAETTTDDDILLFEALNLHDELEQVIARCAEIKGAVGSEPSNESAEPIPPPENGTIIDTMPDTTVGDGLTNDVEVRGGETAVVHKDEKEQAI